jgi:putative DNA primase/helicase
MEAKKANEIDIINTMKSENQKIRLMNGKNSPTQKENFNLSGENARDLYNKYRDTDKGNADRLIQVAEGLLKYVDGQGWHYFHNGRWTPNKAKAREIVKKDVAGLVWKEVAGAAADRNEDGMRKLTRWAKQSENLKKVDAALAMANTDPHFFIRPDQLDQGDMLLNCKNGTLDLKTGKLKAFDKDQLLTKQLNTAYKPGEKCPIWENFLLEIFDNDLELINYIQKAIGYSLTGSTKQQAWFLCFGHGANGKSVLMNTILDLLDGYAMQAAPDLLLQSKSNQQRHPAELADLKGRRLVIAQESDEGRLLAEATIKQMTGGDKLKARHLYGDFFEFESTHKLWLATNHKPAVKDTTESTWRRLKLIPFQVTIPVQKRDHDLPEKLRSEFEGILSWAVKGCLKWQKEGLRDVAAITKATASYKKDSNTIGLFVEEKIETSIAGHVKQSELYACYRDWAHDNGYRPISSKRLREALEERGIYQSVYSGARVMKNIRILN